MEAARSDRFLVFRPIETALWELWLLVVFAGLILSGFSLTGAIGLRYYLVPLLVLLIHPVLANDTAELEHFVSHYLAVCVGVCLLGFVQFASGPDSLINRYSWSPSSEMDVATFGEVSTRLLDLTYVRITGTFSYISPYASYLQFAWFAAIGMFVTAQTERARFWYAVVIVLILANLFMTGSRAPVVVCILAGLLFVPSARKALGSRFGFVGLFLGSIIFIVGMWLASDVTSALVERNQEAGDASGRVLGARSFPFTP